MTSIHLALGQTGADVASHFWAIAAADAADANDKRRRKGALFDVRRQTCRGIVVDGDDRALEGCLTLGGKRPVFDGRNVVTKGNFGCGKCFGQGFAQRAELRRMAEERLRKEAERCSRVGTLSFLYSIDGGTSGLASTLLQGARDDYPASTLLGVALGRRGFGSPMAAYNACLSLHQLVAYADATIWRDYSCDQSVPEPNQSFAADLAGLFLPRVQDNIERQFCGRRDVVLRCCSSLPFCDVRSTLSKPAKKSDDWPKLAGKLADAFPKADLLDRPLIACAATAWARGVDGVSMLPLATLRKRLAPDARRAPPGAVLFEPHALYRSSATVGGQRSLTCLAQTNLAPALLVDYLDKLAKLRSVGAYAHRFAKFGLEDADFAVASEALCGVVDAYDARFGYLPEPPPPPTP